jgi:hypothetical protein
MSTAEKTVLEAQPGLRWYQFRLRTLLILAVPVALLACFLRFWLPWLNPGPKNVSESALLASLEFDQLESVFRQLISKGTFHRTRSKGRGHASPQRGKWLRQMKGALTCEQDVTDRAMRSFKSQLQKAVRQHGGKIGEEEETLEESFLAGFRFDYVVGEHRGSVETTLGPEIPMGPPGFDRPPLRRMVIRIKEWVGFAEDAEIMFWEYEEPPPDEDSTPTRFYLPFPVSRERSEEPRSPAAGREAAR